MTPITLAAGVSSDWFDLRDFASNDIAVAIVIAGGASAQIEGSNDPARVKSADVFALEAAYAATVAKSIGAPLPSFMRVKNLGGGDVTFSFSRGTNSRGEACEIKPQTFDYPTSGAFSV